VADGRREDPGNAVRRDAYAGETGIQTICRLRKPVKAEDC
jgi:hypothetical protein